MPPKLTVEKINNEIASEGYICINYSVLTKKFDFICPNNHTGSMRLDHWRKGVRCAVCSGNKKLTIEYVRASFIEEGYVLLSEEYINSSSLLECICPNDHTYKVSWNNWSTGYRCSTCSGRKVKDIAEIYSSFSDEGYLLTESSYINNKAPLSCICPNNHIYSVSWDNWNSKSSRCPRCSEWGKSKAELELLDFIKEIYSGEILTNDRTVLGNKELDIVLPQLNLAIEYCGLYWHSEALGKDRYYHVNKLNTCLDKNIKLITIFEDEWVSNKDVVKSRLGSYINSSNNTKVFARKCKIQEISSATAKAFCTENHLQGYGAGASIRLGCFYLDELIAVMTFSKPSLAKGIKSAQEGVWELHRFCTKKNFTLLGGASKLLSFFEKNYFCIKIYSFADRRWSNGKLYDCLGFKKDSITQPNYWYFIDNTKRLHRFGFRKTKYEKDTGTEKSLRIKQGFSIIWDCGNLKYVKDVIN